MNFHHIPVMPEEVLEYLNIRPDRNYLDATAGGGGHSAQIAGRLTTGRLLALDRDPQAVHAAGERLAPWSQAEVREGNFAEMDRIAEECGLREFHGILMDLGVSSHQLDTPERGFSYHSDAPLDMRMSGAGTTAKEILETASVSELTRIFRDYGEERYAYGIAKRIDRERQRSPIETCGQLVEIIKRSIPSAARRDGHPAKRVFQALRIEVNDEFGSLNQALEKAFGLLAAGGRLVVITFHSLEDRMVKQAFAEFAKGCICPPDFPVCVCGKQPMARPVTRKPVTAGDRELEQNNRARSAKLRVLEKTETPSQGN